MKHRTFIKEIDGADTAILFIHGFLGSTEHFEKFIEAVPKNISIYNILLKGHGGSVKKFANSSMKEWKNQISDITAFMAEKYENIYVVAHSMGTFFAMELSLKYKNKIKGIFLLQIPLKIWVKPVAIIGTFKLFYNIFKNERLSRAYKNSHSVKLNFRFWEYLLWIPRCVELFSEAKKARNTILKISVPTVIFQSKNDELVSFESVKFIPKKDNIKLTVLKKSAHFIYYKNELELMVKEFVKFYGKRDI